MAEKAKSSGQVHAGHRQRLKDRFLKSGLDHMEPHVVLELLLFYAIPQGDVNPLAHRLLDRFGNLYGVCSAPVEELTQVPGVGPNTAVLLKLLLPLCRELLRQQNETGDRVVDAQTAYQMLSPLFLGRKEEAVGLLLLDSRGRPFMCGIWCGWWWPITPTAPFWPTTTLVVRRYLPPGIWRLPGKCTAHWTVSTVT